MAEQPDWQPISRLPLIGSMIDGMLQDAEEHYQTLLEAFLGRRINDRLSWREPLRQLIGSLSSFANPLPYIANGQVLTVEIAKRESAKGWKDFLALSASFRRRNVKEMHETLYHFHEPTTLPLNEAVA